MRRGGFGLVPVLIIGHGGIIARYTLRMREDGPIGRITELRTQGPDRLARDLLRAVEKLERLEQAMEEQRREWQALMTRLDPLLAMAETMTRWRNPLRRS